MWEQCPIHCLAHPRFSDSPACWHPPGTFQTYRCLCPTPGTVTLSVCGVACTLEFLKALRRCECADTFGKLCSKSKALQDLILTCGCLSDSPLGQPFYLFSPGRLPNTPAPNCSCVCPSRAKAALRACLSDSLKRWHGNPSLSDQLLDTFTKNSKKYMYYLYTKIQNVFNYMF